jgi:UDP-2,3-diacylglucosamine pyrophosphatase LpxH
MFQILGAFSLVVLGLALLEKRLKARTPPRSTHILSFFVRAGTLLGLVIVVFAFVFVGIIPSPYNAGTAPQLLIEDGSGINGVPNLAVTFRTPSANTNTVKWGTGTAALTLTETSSREHVFTLKDLQPDTSYWYQVNDGQKQYFTTAPAAGKPLHFAVASDAHFGNSKSRNDLTAKMLQYIADPVNKYSMLFSLGDLVDYGFKDANWQEALQVMSATTSSIPVKYAAGNHETILGGLKRYETYCDPAEMPLQTGTQLWQRIDVGNVHFLVIDLEWSAESFTAAQSEWLTTQLASIPQNDWKIVVGHGFYYASGSLVEGWKWYDNPETISKLTPIFEKYGVDMVFSGHDHQLELLQKSGVSYVLCGAFGGPPEQPRHYTSPQSVWYSTGNYAFVDVTINGANANLVFRDSDNKEIKSLVIPKN